MTTQKPPPMLPYPGLRPFHGRESKLFFGREGQVKGIIERLQEHHFAAVMGGSGSGKSSIVRAGVIPKLRAYGISEQGAFWVPITFTPGDAPISRLVNELEEALEPLRDAARLERRQRITRILEHPDGLETFLSEYHAELKVGPGLEEIRPHANLLVVADQFEEIFRREGRKTGQCRLLVELLVGAFKRRSDNVYIIITLRTEDLHRCAAYLSLPEVLNETVFLTRRLSEDELEQAIERPPRVIARQLRRQLGLEESRSIVFDHEMLAELYDDLAANRADNDHLPLLQHLLYRVWEHACRKTDPAPPQELTLQDLRAATGDDSVAATTSDTVAESGNKSSLLARCLETEADRIYDQLRDEHCQDVARVMFQLLAYQDNAGNYTRRWTDREKIRAQAVRTTKISGYTLTLQRAIVDEVISAFCEPHPYIRVETDGDQKIDVSHEALIRKWPKFRGWLQDERAAIGVYQQIDEHYLETMKACKGNRGLLRCRERYVGGRLPRRLLAKVKNRKILERGQGWVHSYEILGGGLFEEGTKKRFPQVEEHIRWSRRIFKREMWAAGLLALVLVAGFGGWRVSAYRADVLEDSRDAFEREAEIFQPMVVGAQMEQPSGDWGRTTNRRYLVALWEGAVALRALEELEAKHPDLHIVAAKQVEGEEESEREQRHRFARAVRLAFGTVNKAVYSLLGVPVWNLDTDTDGSAPVDTRKPTEAQNVAKTGNEKDMACRKSLGIGSVAELYREHQRGNGGVPGKGVYFNPKAERQSTFYSVSGNRCHLVRQQQEAPDSDLIYIDPALRFYVIKAEVPVKKQLKFVYTFVALRWTPAPCEQEQTEKGCEKSWWLTSSGKVRVPLGSKKEPSDFRHTSGRILLFSANHSESLAPSPPLVTQVEGPPIIADSECRERLHGLGFKTNDVCAMKGPLIAIATQVEGVADAYAKEQVIHILVDNRPPAGGDADAGKDTGMDIVKLPIATLPFAGEKITGLSLGDRESKVSGELWLQFESGTLLKTVWGGKALREMACSVLKQLPTDRQKGVRDSPLHSPFFTEMAKSDSSIVKKNRSFARICEGTDGSESPD